MPKTQSTDFLPAVADYILTHYGEAPQRVVFVTPNKRASLFLKQAYCQGLGDRPGILPHFATMANFMARFTDKLVVDADEQLFILYNAYINVLRRKNPDQAIPEFDSFLFWGKMILSDFDELNSAMVDARALFKNLKDVKEIQANYLDEDQIAVINHIWGEGLMPSGTTEFWKHLRDESGNFRGEMSAKFFAIWELLSDIYDEFESMLETAGMVAQGRLERDTLALLKETSAEDLQDGYVYAFVGHNSVTRAEALIMKRLKDTGAAIFFWDSAVLNLFANSLTGTQPKPMKILQSLVKEFPSPKDFHVPIPEQFAKLTIQAVPSNVGQTKMAHNVLEHWADLGYIATDSDPGGTDPMRTAVILPDPDLLVPLLYAIPGDINPVNIAMGIPYRVTGFANFFSSLLSMQLRSKKYRNGYNYFYEDLQNVVMQPHVRLFKTQDSDAILEYITNNRLYNIPANDLLRDFPDMAPLFTPIKELNNAEAVKNYLLKVFDWVETGLDAVSPADVEAAEGGSAVEPGYESKMVKYFRSVVERLYSLIERYSVQMKEHTFLHLFERVFAQRGIIAAGQPLEGLQVLGVLETRAIDFDNVVIMSMNERIYPKRQYSNTMIPAALRAGYGLPDFDSLEHTYAYCFYRMIVRSKRVTVLYDARTDGLGGGEISRYVSQVRYLLPQVKIKSDVLAYPTATHPTENFEIAKSDKVMANLKRMLYNGPKGPSFSASALKAYLSCPLSFYLQYALGFREPEDLVDYKTAADFGTIYHNVVQALFATAPGGVINKSVLTGFKENTELLRDLAKRAVLLSDERDRSLTLADMDPTRELTPEGELIVHYVEVNVANMLDVEIATLGNSSFEYIASEWNFESKYKTVPWTIGNQTIRFKMSIDRVDRLPDGTLRLIDFKTGSDDLVATTFDKVFGKEHNYHAIFQLFLYSQALLDNAEYATELMPIGEIQPVISATQKMAATRSWDYIQIPTGNPVYKYSQVQPEFYARLTDVINEIYDRNVPLRQTTEQTTCSYCAFQTLCGRFSKDIY